MSIGNSKILPHFYQARDLSLGTPDPVQDHDTLPLMYIDHDTSVRRSLSNANMSKLHLVSKRSFRGSGFAHDSCHVMGCAMPNLSGAVLVFA